VRAGLPIVFVLLLALVGAACDVGGGGPELGEAATTPAPAAPEPLISAACAHDLNRTDREAAAVIAARRTGEAALRKARKRLEKAKRDVGGSQARLRSAERSVRSSRRELQAARAALEEFDAAHPERALPPRLYARWQALLARYEEKLAVYQPLNEAYRRALGRHNRLINAHNRRIDDVNRIVRRLNRLGRRHATLSRRYRRDVMRCLADNAEAVTSQRENVQALEERLGGLATELAGRAAEARCSLTRWNKKETISGYVQGGSAVMQLSPGVCLALYRLVILGEKPDLACLPRSRKTGVRSCSTVAEETVFSIATVAHEAQHIGGVENEARAECFGLQQAPEAVRALGLDRGGRNLAWYAWRFSQSPKSYRSNECRPGGTLDRSRETRSWP
jgi:phosphoglycolate phosphatase-like HAD superfamily hydrolase